VKELIAGRLSSWRALLVELIRRPSEFGKEHDMVAFVAERIRSFGLEPTMVSHGAAALRGMKTANPPFLDDDSRCSMIVRIAGSASHPSLIINSPLDIVPAGDPSRWMHPPFSGYVDEHRNRIYGRGAVDAKASVAVALALLELLARGDISHGGDIVFHFVLEDETTGNGTLLCLERGPHANAAMIIDGTRLDRAIVTQVGTMRFRVRVTGRPASISVAHLGANAIEDLCELALRLTRRIRCLNESKAPPWDVFPFPFQCILHKVNGAGGDQTVPEQAEAELYVTYVPPETRKSIMAVIGEECRRFAGDAGIDVPDLDWSLFNAEPASSSDAALFSAIQASAERAGLPGIAFGPSTGTSDLRHFAARGIPCVLYGPGSGQNPHRYDESYDLDDLPRTIEFYANLILQWTTSSS